MIDIKETIMSHFDNCASAGTISMDSIESVGHYINTILQDLHHFHKIENQVMFYCSFFKWIEEDNGFLSREDANGWDDAEELNIAMIIRRKNRKKNSEHFAIIEECLNRTKNFIDMDLFKDIEIEIINHSSKDYPVIGKTSYETIGEIVFHKK